MRKSSEGKSRSGQISAFIIIRKIIFDESGSTELFEVSTSFFGLPL